MSYTFEQIERLSEAFFKSAYYPDCKSPEQALVKIMAGQEVGFGPCAAMKGVQIIGGSPSFSAGLISTLIRRSGHYDYKITEHTDEACTVVFYRDGQRLGESRFTIEDATRAGLAAKAIWKQYPKALLFARALTQGTRFFCPDVSSGVTLYTPEELGLQVADTTPTQATPEPVSAPEPDGDPDPTASDNYQRMEAMLENIQAAFNRKGDAKLGTKIAHRFAAIWREAADTMGFGETPLENLSPDQMDDLCKAVSAKIGNAPAPVNGTAKHHSSPTDSNGTTHHTTNPTENN